MYVTETKRMLNTLGITRRYLGHAAALYVVGLVLEDESRLYNCKDRILRPVAERCGSTPANIERNLRTAIAVAWRTNASCLAALAGYPLTEPPTVLEFIDILACAILHQRFV